MNMVLSVTKGLLFKSGRVEPTVYEKKKEAERLENALGIQIRRIGLD